MRKQFTLILLFLLISSVNAQNWTSLNPGTTKHVNSVFFVNAQLGYIAGDSNLLMKTTNGGLSWTALLTGDPDTTTWKSIFFTDANNGWVVGSSGIIQRTNNGGANWDGQILLTYVHCLHSVCFPSTDTGYVVGFGSSEGYGMYENSTDGGVTWPNQGWIGTRGLRSVYFPDKLTGYAVGDSGTIIKTLNGGITMNPQSSGTYSNLYSVYFTDSNTGYVAGENGILLKTIDGGDNWTSVASGTSNRLASVFFPSQVTGYTAGANGTILNTNDGGASWRPLFSGSSQNLHAIHFPTIDTGYAAGDHGTVLKTTNGGGVGIGRGIASLDFIHIFPNPATDLLTVDLAGIHKNATLSVINTKGMLIYREDIKTNKIRIDMSKFVPAVYFLQYTDEKNLRVFKIIKK